MAAGRIVTVGIRRLQILDSTRLDSSFLLDFQNPLASLLSPLPLPPPSFLSILGLLVIYSSHQSWHSVLFLSHIHSTYLGTLVLTYVPIIDPFTCTPKRSVNQTLSPAEQRPLARSAEARSPLESPEAPPKNKHPTRSGTWCIPVGSEVAAFGVMKWLP